MSSLIRELRFNVAGDPKDDEPILQPDNPKGTPPIVCTLGTEDAAGVFSPGPPFNRMQALIPHDKTGGSWVSYQHGAKSFRVILPPLDIETQAEAGEPPQLPPEYLGDADKVALHYAWKPPVRPGRVWLNHWEWMDDAGAFRPLGKTLMWAVGGWHRGDADRVRENFAWMAAHACTCVRILGQVDWEGEEIDPHWPDYQATLGAVIDCAYEEGLRVHFTVTGGGDDPVGGARIMQPVLDARREKLMVIEAVNEDNASVDDAVAIVELLKPLGVPIAVGLGNIGLDAINEATRRAGATVGILHDERSTDPGRNIRQCWDFRLLEGAPACTEPQGPASSVAEETVADYLAAARAGRIICGAGIFIEHDGHGVFGRTYPYSANTPPGSPHSDTRFENVFDVPPNPALEPAARLDAVAGADLYIPPGVENWPKFNQNQPVTIYGGTAGKLYGAIAGNSFVELAIWTENGTTFRAEQPLRLKIVDPGTAEVLLDEPHLTAGQVVGVPQRFNYLLIGELAVGPTTMSAPPVDDGSRAND